MSLAHKRAELLTRRADALAMYERAMRRASTLKRYTDEEREALDAANQALTEAFQLEGVYYRMLPPVMLSRCPFDDTPLYRTFDPYGLDGPWWRRDASPTEPETCRHFCGLVGALDLAGRPPRGGDFEAHVGPQVPFVIPRLLELPGLIAVLSCIPMESGYRAFPIGYFAEHRPPPQTLTAGWPRTQYLYSTQLGEVRWRTANERYDFNLEPWFRSGKLRWTVGDSLAFAKVSAHPADCPYLDLPGEHRPTVVRADRAWTEPLPDGKPLWPMR
jgi:hypothetical protein